MTPKNEHTEELHLLSQSLNGFLVTSMTYNDGLLKGVTLLLVGMTCMAQLQRGRYDKIYGSMNLMLVSRCRLQN